MIKKFKNQSINTIMYHYVREIKKSKFTNLKGLEFKKFREQIITLKKNCHILNINDFKEILEKNKIPKKKFCILTFDDGYKDHFKYVFEELSRQKISGFFYVPSKILENYTVLDVNKIHFILEAVNNKKIILYNIKKKLNEYEIDLNKINIKKINLYSKYDTREVVLIKRLLQYFLPFKIRTKIIDNLFKKFVTLDEKLFSKNLYLSKKEIIEMSKSNMYFGCHSHSHNWYEHMDKNTINIDIQKSINFFKKIKINIVDAGVAYPYGSYNNDTLINFKKKRFNFGFTTQFGSINNYNFKKKLILPRIDTNEIC